MPVCPSFHYYLAPFSSAASAELFISNQRSLGKLLCENSHPQNALYPLGLYTWYPHRKPFPLTQGFSWFPWEVAAAPSICVADKAFAFRLRTLAHKPCSGICPRNSEQLSHGEQHLSHSPWGCRVALSGGASVLSHPSQPSVSFCVSKLPEGDTV